MSKKLSFSTAFITGATSGIGEALARLLASKGIPLILLGRDYLKLELVATELKAKVPVTTLRVDLRQKEGRKQAVSLIHVHSPDLIVNCAGLGYYGEALKTSLDEQLSMIDINVSVLVELSLEGAKNLIENKKTGTILNVSSAAAFFAYPYFAVYAASKAFVKQFSLGLDAETRPYGVRVLTACPGVVATDFQRRASKGNTKTPPFSFSKEKAARLLLSQIEKQKKLCIFDWKYKISTFIGIHFLRQSFLEKILKKSISSRLFSKK